MTKPHVPCWQQPETPQALNGPAFRQWHHRIYKHKESVRASHCHTDLAQYEREVAELCKVASGSERIRRFKKEEKDAAMRRDNACLVKKICDIARQSERRKVKLIAPAFLDDSIDCGTLNEPVRRREQLAIDKENAALLRRLETARSIVPSAVQSARSYDQHVARSARMSRFQRPVNATERPPLPPRRPKGPRPALTAKPRDYELPPLQEVRLSAERQSALLERLCPKQVRISRTPGSRTRSADFAGQLRASVPTAGRAGAGGSRSASLCASAPLPAAPAPAPPRAGSGCSASSRSWCRSLTSEDQVLEQSQQIAEEEARKMCRGVEEVADANTRALGSQVPQEPLEDLPEEYDSVSPCVSSQPSPSPEYDSVSSCVSSQPSPSPEDEDE